MKLILRTILFWMACIGISSCSDCELPSDEELRQGIVGVWESVQCDYPFHTSLYNDYPFPGGSIEFRENGTFVQMQSTAVCRDSCGIDSVSTSGYILYCTCEWSVEDGKLFISTDTVSVSGYFGFPFPVRCLDKGELMVLDRTTFNGHDTEGNACFERR